MIGKSFFFPSSSYYSFAIILRCRVFYLKDTVGNYFMQMGAPLCWQGWSRVVEVWKVDRAGQAGGHQGGPARWSRPLFADALRTGGRRLRPQQEDGEDDSHEGQNLRATGWELLSYVSHM